MYSIHIERIIAHRMIWKQQFLTRADFEQHKSNDFGRGGVTIKIETEADEHFSDAEEGGGGASGASPHKRAKPGEAAAPLKL